MLGDVMSPEWPKAKEMPLFLSAVAELWHRLIGFPQLRQKRVTYASKTHGFFKNDGRENAVNDERNAPIGEVHHERAQRGSESQPHPAVLADGNCNKSYYGPLMSLRGFSHDGRFYSGLVPRYRSATRR